MNEQIPATEEHDVVLAGVVREIESHVAEAGWDQPARMYALVETVRLVADEPELAAALELDDAAALAALAPGALTPIEQELPADEAVEAVLEEIVWPPNVDGCAVVIERLVLPPEIDDQIPEDAAEAAAFANEHPLRQEVRMVAGVTRTGSTYCALRLRAHDDEQSVVDGTELVPGLIELLRGTLEEETP